MTTTRERSATEFTTVPRRSPPAIGRAWPSSMTACRISCSIWRTDVTLACPACGKKRLMVDGPTRAGDSLERDACDRCGCDLSQLHTVLRAAAAFVRMAKTSLEEGGWDRALACADRSWSLAHSVNSA